MSYRSSGLYYLGLFLAAWVFFLLMAGGAVTSHEAGLAVPDWPLSYGQWFPPMVGNIFWEHGHRMIAGVAAILTVAAAILAQIKERRVWLKKLAWTAVGIVLFQALLGGITVLLLLPPAVSISHAALGQTYFCLVLTIAYYLSPLSVPSAAEEHRRDARLKRLSLMTAAFVYAQLILGAAVRHTGHGVELHIAAAFLVVIHVVLLLLRIWRFYEKRQHLLAAAIALAVLTLIQVFLGIGSFDFTRMVERGYAPSLGEVVFTVAHQSTGALILGLAVLIAIMVHPIPPEGQ